MSHSLCYYLKSCKNKKPTKCIIDMKYFTLNKCYNAMFKKRYFSTYEHSYNHLQNLCYVKIINNHFFS